MNKKKPVIKDKKIGIDMLHYTANRLSFWLIILAIALNIVMFLIIYKTTECTSNVLLGIDLLINVIFMLVCFLAAEKTKHYSKTWGITSICLGGFQIIRIFIVPLYYYLMFVANNKTGLPTSKFVWCVILLVLCAAALIAGGVYSIIKHKVISNNKPLLEIEGAKKDVRT